jgi:hypothetical protein
LGVDVTYQPREAILVTAIIIMLHPLAGINPSVLVQLVSTNSLALVTYGIRIEIRFNHSDRVQELVRDDFRRLSGSKRTKSQQAE